MKKIPVAARRTFENGFDPLSEIDRQHRSMIWSLHIVDANMGANFFTTAPTILIFFQQQE